MTAAADTFPYQTGNPRWKPQLRHSRRTEWPLWGGAGVRCRGGPLTGNAGNDRSPRSTHRTRRPASIDGRPRRSPAGLGEPGRGPERGTFPEK